MNNSSIWTIELGSQEYPINLANISDPPKVLYGIGERNFSDVSLSVIGTRKPSNYGTDVAKSFSTFWAQRGIQIVSGLALGIDAIAHKAAVDARGSTIAVLASGVDDPTPRTNRALAYSILDTGGTIISEYPPGTEAFPTSFPKRNRIIAGLSQATVVIEGSNASGTLGTASLASRYGRPVLAVPGNVNSPLSFAPNHLIQIGAHPLLRPEEALEILGLKDNMRLNLDQLESFEHTLLEALSSPVELDILSQSLKIPIPKLLSSLMELELKGAVRKTEDESYVRVH